MSVSNYMKPDRVELFSLEGGFCLEIHVLLQTLVN